ncbi:MAG: phenylacetate--CoA ligase family protein [Lachnospiraceae bacterium]|nr:phenylacetate--CoA ligase family protein [Lachnospiraceae bacterium]
MKQTHTEIGEAARWKGYFALDLLKGGVVQKRFKQDAYAYRHGTSVEETNERIRSLIAHAAETTSYYAPFGRDAALSELPVVNKDIWRSSYEDFRSSKYKDASDNRIMTTSGSTGTPLSMVQNRGKILSNTADSIFLGALGNYRIGEKMAFIRVWVNNVRKSRIRLLMENSIMMDSSSLSDEAIDEMLTCIKNEKVKCLIGYSSALGEISRYVKEHDVKTDGFSVHSIIPISEMMPDGVREQLKKQFGCTVMPWYSNEENGIMGITGRDDNSYYINSESYFYEFLKMDSDEPAEEGELARVVITDLTNEAFPILRYDNGDTAVAGRIEKNGRFKLFLRELYGRRSDILYDTSGRPVTAYVITNNLWNVEGVSQYRFLQTGLRNYELRLNGDSSRIDEAEILGRIAPYFGNDADIKVTYVDEIPVLASGKRKYIENLCPEYQGRKGHIS